MGKVNNTLLIMGVAVIGFVFGYIVGCTNYITNDENVISNDTTYNKIELDSIKYNIIEQDSIIINFRKDYEDAKDTIKNEDGVAAVNRFKQLVDSK